MRYIYIYLLLVFTSTQILAQTKDSLYLKYKPQFYEIDGYKINVETLGNGDAIFIFPGGPGNSHDYLEAYFGHYYTTHQVVFIDLLGRGMSDDAKDVSEYSIENDVHIAEEVRKILKLDKIIVVGHSYGTMVAQAYSIKYPERVKKMILLDSFHSGEMWQANCDNYNYNTKIHFPEQWRKVDSLRTLGYISSDSAFISVYHNIPSDFMYLHNTKLRYILPKKQFRGINIDVYFGIIGKDADFYVCDKIMKTDFRKELGKLDIPTLIVAGRYDCVSTPEYVMQYKKYMPKAQLVMFEDSGHYPYLEEPDKFYKLLDNFLGIKK